MNLVKRIYNRFFSRKSQVELELEELKSQGLTIGKNTSCYSAGAFDHIYPHLIAIGEDTIISSNVTILAHDASTNVVGCGTKVGKVSIGNRVFVGAGVTILCDVTIGDNVVIGTGSVVTRSLPSDGVYGGVPARRICSIEEFRRKNEALRKERPDLSQILPWYEWPNASAEQKQQMKDILEDGAAFI